MKGMDFIGPIDPACPFCGKDFQSCPDCGDHIFITWETHSIECCCGAIFYDEEDEE